MVFFFFCIFLLVACWGLWHLMGRAPARRHGWHVVWRVAAVIGLVRISALWLGTVLWTLTNIDWPWPAFGYLLLMTTFPESYLVRRLLAHEPYLGMAMTLLLAATS